MSEQGSKLSYHFTIARTSSGITNVKIQDSLRKSIICTSFKK